MGWLGRWVAADDNVYGLLMPHRASQHFIYRVMITAPGVVIMKVLRGATRSPRLCLAWLVAAVLLCLPGVPKQSVLLSVSEMLSPTSVDYRQNQRYQEAFPVGHPLTLIFQNPQHQPLTAGQLCAIKIWWDQQKYSLPYLRDAYSLFEARQAVSYPQTNQVWYEHILRRDCLTQTQATLNVSRDRWLSGYWQHLLVNPELTTLVMELQFSDTAQSAEFGHYPVAVIDQVVLEAQQLAASQQLHVAVQGVAGFKHYFIESLRKDQRINVVVALVLLGLYRLIFGRWRGAFILVGTQLLTLLLILGMMGYAAVPIDILSNSLFAIIALAVTEDFIFLAGYLQQQPTSWRTAFRQVALPAFYTTVTTMIGFGSLMLSHILPIQRLGFWVMIGTGIEWIICFIFLPAALTLWPSWRKLVAEERTRLFRLLGYWTARLPGRRLWLALSLLTVAGIFGLTQIHSNDALDAMWDRDHPFTDGLHTLSQTLGWRGQFELMVPRSHLTPEFEKALKRIPNVRHLESSWFVINDVVAGIDQLDLRQMVQRELSAYDWLDRYRDRSGNLERVLLYVKEIDTQSIDQTYQQINKVCQQYQCVLVGELANHARFATQTIATLMESFALSLGLIIIILSLLAWAFKTSNAIAMLFSAVWGPVVLLGMIPLLTGGVNFVSCVFAAVLVGLAGDNCIQFIFSARGQSLQHGINDRGMSALIMTVMMTLASTAYFLSDFQQPRVLGALFCAGYVLLFVGDVWILRGLIQWTQAKEHVWRRLLPSRQRIS